MAERECTILSNLSISLQEKAKALEKWERLPEPQKEYTLSWIVKNSIKMMILGFIIGAVLVAVFIAFRYITSDKVQDAKDLKNRSGMRVIAQLPKVHGKRLWVGFDRLFARMGGLVLKESDAGALAELAAMRAAEESVGQSAGAKESERSVGEESLGGESGKSQDTKLAFTGNIASDEIDKLLGAIKWDGAVL